MTTVPSPALPDAVPGAGFHLVRTPRDGGPPLEPEYSESIRLRDDLGACVRARHCCAFRCLGRPDVVMFDESSLTEEYSDTTKSGGTGSSPGWCTPSASGSTSPYRCRPSALRRH